MLCRPSFGQLTMEDFNEAVELNNTGYELLAAGRFRESLSYFTKAIQNDSTERMYFLNLNAAVSATKDFRLGKKYFDIAKSIFTEDDEIFYCAGLLNKNLGLYELAVEDFTQAIKFSANYDEQSEQFYAFFFNRGVCHLKLEQYRLAQSDFSKTLEINPYHYGAYANRGMARYNLKDKPGACKDWSSAVENGYTEAQTYLEKYCR